MKGVQVPEFTSLVNFPSHMSQKQSHNLPEGMRCCVMCGHACPCSAANKNKKGAKVVKCERNQMLDDLNSTATSSSNNNNGNSNSNNGGMALPLGSSNGQGVNQQHPNGPMSNPGGSYAIIPTQNKGLCTHCDANVWVCKGCKNSRPWAAFGEKGLATKCVRCRERQREKYAAQKEEKEKNKALAG